MTCLAEKLYGCAKTWGGGGEGLIGEGGRVPLCSCHFFFFPFETRNSWSVCVENFKLEVIQFGAFDAAPRCHKMYALNKFFIAIITILKQFVLAIVEA